MLEQILNCQSIPNQALINFNDGSLSLIVAGHKSRGEKNTGTFEKVCIPLLRQVVVLSVRLRTKTGRGLPLKTIHTLENFRNQNEFRNNWFPVEQLAHRLSRLRTQYMLNFPMDAV